MDTIRDIIGPDTETPAQPVDNASPQQFNIDPSLGPTWSNLPNPGYQPTTEQAQFRDLANTLKSIPIRSISEAQQAIAFATELEGKLGFDADVRAGVPTHEALMKWAPKLYSRNPAAIARMVEPPFDPTLKDIGGNKMIQTSRNRFQLLPQDIRSGGALTAQPIMTPEGVPIEGVHGIPGRSGGVHVIRDQKEITPYQQQQLLQNKIKDLDQQLRDSTEGSPEETAIKEQLKTYRQQLHSAGTKTTHKAAPRDPAQRVAGEVYMTPKGPHKWTGVGWTTL